MKFSSVLLLNDKRTSVNENLRDNAYSFSALRGWDIELVGSAVVLRHDGRSTPLVIPFASVERAELIEVAVEERRKPGPKSANA